MSYIPRILVVDDEPHVCESLRVLLKRQGYNILTATSGRRALELLDGNRFDLLLLDMVIPDINGSQIMDYVNRHNLDVAIIVITGNASIESAVTALRKGAFDYLKKPFEYEELQKRVSNAVEQRRLSHEKTVINGKLQRSELRYQHLVQNSPDIIYVLDSEGRFLFANVAIKRLLGFDPEQLNGRSFSTIVHEKDQERVSYLLSSAQPRNDPLRRREMKLRRCDDERTFKTFEISHVIIDLSYVDGDLSGSGVYGVARDISYRRQLEEQLQHAKKMEAIGSLAGGIAHDFNNILMGILGYTSLVLTKTEPDNPVHAKLLSIEQYVRSGAHLTQQLLSVARGRSFEVKPVNMHQVIEKTAGMFGRTKKEMALELDFADPVWTVMADEGQIEQVLLNLYVNAWQAMPGGGTVVIETENITIHESLSYQLGIEPGRYVCIRVRDNGVGMDEAVRQRVFEPFFTTKGDEKGTGLGLASAFNIMKNHDGTITVESTKGQGTTFSLFLPATDQAVQQEQTAHEAVIRGDETVFLVDDEEVIIDVGVELLQELGYRVLSARSGEEALKRYREHKDEIDIIIVDLIMPHMNGGELCDSIRGISPDVKILLSSGYSIEGKTAEILQRSCNGFIQKPFALTELSKKLREVLDT